MTKRKFEATIKRLVRQAMFLTDTYINIDNVEGKLLFSMFYYNEIGDSSKSMIILSKETMFLLPELEAIITKLKLRENGNDK